MTVSGPPAAINRARSRAFCVWAVACLVLACGAAGCIPTLTPASFPVSGDSTDPGNLLGPFDGQVTDAGSGHPLPGALVWVSWRFCHGTGLCIPAGTETFSVETDADGRYHVPRLVHFPGAVRLDGVTLVAYKRGYIGYRSDHVFDPIETDAHGTLVRHDFSQLRNLVKLEHFPDGASHAAHLAFLGGSGALRAALRAEALQVAVERGSPEVASASPLDATTLLSVEELRQATGSVDDFTVERLEDKPRTPRYDSAHFRSNASGEGSDAAFRVYLSDTPADSDRDFDTLLADLPNAEAIEPPPAGLGARASRGHDTAAGSSTSIRGLLVEDRAHRAIVLVTCGSELCTTDDAIDSVARKVIARMPRVAHPPPEPKQTKPKPEDQHMQLREPELRR